MSTPELEQFSLARLPATLRAVRTLSLVCAIVSVMLLVFVIGVESVLPIDGDVVVRDGVGLAVTSAASWSLYAVAVWISRAYPQSTGAFGAVLIIMIGLGALAFVLNFVIDLILSPDVLAIAVPAALIVCVVVPGVYLAFVARAVTRHAAR